ncbi:diguanylate cyclase domain-containing protein [Geobacillus jurassicus]|uniref:Diguanylate cyclase domain-containing protein n=1 Tax=Geobacillus jurassicus TaxID=235932 RepID=A0ABV6GXC7_9BACL|nr:diguanylate cyclase [Geobacillus jurassicus]
MALFTLLVTVPACQVIKTGHGDRKFFITTYIEKLLADISREIHKYNEQSTNIKIKMSAGIAFSSTSIGNMNELFAQADKNMYREKKAKKQSSKHALNC